MTEVKYKVDGNEYVMSVKGHAGYAESGNDIVCSAISTLVQTLYLCGANKTDARIEPGNVYLHGEGEKAINALEVVLTGLQAIQRSYPKNLRIEGCPIFSDSPLK